VDNPGIHLLGISFIYSVQDKSKIGLASGKFAGIFIAHIRRIASNENFLLFKSNGTLDSIIIGRPSRVPSGNHQNLLVAVQKALISFFPGS